MRPMHVTIGLAGWLAAASVALAQFQVQGGNALDANRRVGSGGLNSAGRADQINSGNRYIQGNVTGGQAFRGYSPIRDASSLFLGSPNTSGNIPGLTGVTGVGGNYGSQYYLPSDRLTSFRRDSFSAADAQYFRTRSAQVGSPYYSHTSTVASTGDIVRGANQPGTSQFMSPYQVPRAETRLVNPIEGDSARLLNRPLTVQPLLVRAPGTTPNINPRLQASPLFAGMQRIPVGQLAEQAENAASTQRNGPGQGRPGRPLDLRPDGSGALDLRVGDTRSRGPVDTTATGAMERLLTGLPGPRDGQPGQTPAQPDQRPGGLLGNLRSAQDSGTLRQPMAGATPEQAPQILEQPSGGRAAEGWAEMSGPLRSFAGPEDSAAATQLKQGEKLLKDGQYYKAAVAFQVAAIINPEDPRPGVGRAMALLAAGDFVTSTNMLFTALNSHEELSGVELDLTAFIPDLRHLDRRRAELEQRLTTFEDFRLRFLLGWAEYHSGMPEPGLANMQRAAAQVPEKFEGVRQYVRRLQIRQTGGEHIRVPAPATRPG